MDIDVIVKKRTATKLLILNIKKTVAGHTENPVVTAKEIVVLTTNLEGHFKTYLDLQNDMYGLCIDDQHIETQVNLTEEMTRIVQDIRDNLFTIQGKLKTTNITSSSTAETNIRLPRIELPSFDGNFEMWTSFHDLFVATIENNKSLSGAQKLQYLKSAVKGDAARLISSFQVTDQNYLQAWKTLLDRYDNERELVYATMKRLFNLSAVTKESPTALQRLLDTTNECVRVLSVLKRPVEQWDDILVFFVSEKMDPEARRQWWMTLKGTAVPKFSELSDFVDQHVRSLVAAGCRDKGSHQESKPKQGNSYNEKKQTTSFHGSTDGNCMICKQEHMIGKCTKFLSMNPVERSAMVKTHVLCFNCLKSNHSVKDCKSLYKCKKCDKKHHTLLHFERDSKETQRKDHSPTAVHSGVCTGMEQTFVLLSTAIVRVKDFNGIDRNCRILLDNGSQATFITEQCAKSLGLERKTTNVKVKGISSTTVGTVRGKIFMEMSSCVHNFVIQVEALILPKVTGNLPKFPVSQQDWTHIAGLQLADPQYHMPGQIDILLGADYVASILREGRREGKRHSPIAINSAFGWILSGRVSATEQQIVVVNHAECNTETVLRRFWELEQLPECQHLTPNEQACEQHFIATHTRDVHGKYTVRLPFKPYENQLGDSRERAMCRLKQLERRLSSHPEMRSQYCAFMKEYVDLHHMKEIPHNELKLSAGNHYYLPHHCVVKSTSTSTKLRVVFDGSAKTTNGKSLNDVLMIGATVQDNLYNILLQFRVHMIALKADIKKMYRQFGMNKEDCDYQRILWRDSPEQQIKDYRLLTVTYGTASAPFLATRCLKQLAEDERLDFPHADHVLCKETYVDDVMSGEVSTEEATKTQKKLCELLTRGNMELCKWSSNDPIVLANIPKDQRETSVHDLDPDNIIKALGVQWNPGTDMFLFRIVTPPRVKVLTKRVVLSELAKIFDPLGFLTPLTIRAKMLMQELWKLSLDWDTEVPIELRTKWENYCDQLQLLQTIEVPRCVSIHFPIHRQLHGFCDASERAYGAVVYLRSQHSDGSITVRLVSSKSKVAPINQVSIPKLELCGALLLSKLFTTIKQVSELNCDSVAWTDSTIVLSWLADYPSRWKTFVANRVAEIQRTLSADHWHHVVSEDNPADCASRGISAAELIDSALWWNGPSWLHHPLTLTMNQRQFDKPIPEERHAAEVTVHLCVESKLASRYSNFNKLKRVTAYCFRFIENCKRHRVSKICGPITCLELEKAQVHWIKYIQAVSFPIELKLLMKSKHIPPSSTLKSLNPYIDATGVLRVGGRLHKTDFIESQKHPAILPHHHDLTKLIIQNVHITNLHAGFQALWCLLQQEFWILRARDTIRHIVRKCVVCRRHRAETAIQLMGSLPSARVTLDRPFQNCGVDYAGPFITRLMKGRNQKTFKSYFAVFVCMATKAVHLEAVSDLSTESFIASFTRFTARRGLCRHMYSDCGTNFVGADRELSEIVQSADHISKVSDHLANQQIQWNFNPPAAPHHGGLWEAGVRSVKFHLKRVIGQTILTFEEFQTVLCQIEACLNSRPLCAMSSDPSDLNVLTPGHFLIGEPLSSLPQHDVTSIKTNRLSRWQHTQQIWQHFWRRWSSEYLSNLQQRFKWTQKRDNVCVGDLVLIKDEQLPPMKWKMGRVISVHQGEDNLVRVVTLKTSSGECTRPIVKLCPLIASTDETLDNK